MSKFLIVRLGSLGDVIHGIPAAAALRAANPQARIDWLVDPRYASILGLVRGIDHAIPTDPRMLGRARDRRRFFGDVRELRRTTYDAVFDFQGLLKSALLARAAGARRTVGFPRAHLREPLARLFYTDAPDPGKAPHVIHKNLALLAAVGIRDHEVRFPLDIPRTPSVDAAVSRLGSAGFAIVNPGAAWPNKRWPPSRFGQIAAEIHERYGWRSLVIWGPGEESIASAVAAASRGAAEMSAPTTIVDLFGIARCARLMISGDTGPLHIAGAVGTPVVALFGPTQPARNGPWSVYDVTLSRVDRCACLYERRCRRASPCIDEISVEEVLDAVDRRLQGH